MLGKYFQVSAASFSPLSLNPVFGVDAFSLSSSPVSSWVDLSTGGHDATQGTGSKQPTWGATAFNSAYPGVTFDGTDDFLRTASFTLSQPMHYFLVCNLVVTSINKVTIDAVIPGGQTAIFQGAAAGNARMFAGANGPTAAISTTPHVISAKFNGASSSIALDNGSATTGNPGANNPGGITLGCDLNSGSAANVIIAACWIYSSILSASDETALVRYLGARYGVAVA